MQLTGAEILTKCLEDLNVKRTFGYTGAAIMHVYDAVAKSKKIDIIINSNEQSAGFSAAGYSRSSNDIGVAIVTSGPAITNILTAAADSYCDSIPMLIFSGQVPKHKIGTDSFQHINVNRLYSGLAAKKVFEIYDVNEIERTIKDAYFLAKSGKPGPVIIDFPMDKQTELAEYKNIDIEIFKEKYNNYNQLTDAMCEKFFNILKTTRKPLLYCGGGVNNINASKELRRLNNILKIPSVTTLMAKGVLDENDDLSLGMLGMFGTPSANTIVQKNDFFLAIGARWDDRVAEKVGCFGPKSRVAYIDINPIKMQQIIEERRPEFTFLGDAGRALKNLADYAEKNNIILDIQEWRNEAILVNKKWNLDFNRESKFIQEAEVMEYISEMIKDKKVKITTGVGNHQMLAAQHIKVSEPKSFISSGSFGTMGFGMPSAIGAYYANNDNTIITIDGDGSLRMNMGELHTIGQYQLPIKIIMLNNHSDGMVKMLQKATYTNSDNPYVATIRAKDINFSKIAKNCCFNFSERVSLREELKDKLAEFINSEGPCFLEILCDPLEEIFPRVPGGKHYSDMILGPYIKEQ
jgi:acetolactate synthase I/II/III large subunit